MNARAALAAPTDPVSWERLAIARTAGHMARAQLQALADELMALTGIAHLFHCAAGAETFSVESRAQIREIVDVPPPPAQADRLAAFATAQPEREVTGGQTAPHARLGEGGQPEPIAPQIQAVDLSGLTEAETTLFDYLAGLGPFASYLPAGEPQCKAAQALVERGLAARDDGDEAVRLSTIGWAIAEEATA